MSTTVPRGPGEAPSLAAPRFDDVFRDALDALLIWRRDVRRFETTPLESGMIERLIDRACLSPSVGYSQPWRFVLAESADVRAAVRSNFLACNRDALAEYAGERARRYAELKLAGLDDAPVQLAVFADTGTDAGYGLGRRTMPAMLQYSVVTAVHTLWLVARAWGIGVGWVSILDPVAVRDALAVPPTWELVAYLCIGYPAAESATPELARTGWQSADPDARVVHRR
jgi:5,6-dimethylbenzimidazole synthase